MARTTILLGLAGIFSLAVLLLAGACGDDEASDSNGHGAVVSPVTQPAAGGDDTLAVNLLEWAIAGEGGETDLAAAAGTVTFEVENIGATPHELAVFKTDADAGSLPYDDAAAAVNEDEAGELAGRTETLDGAASETLALELDAGSYALICNIATHYDQGMFASLTVE
jgi:uncharacterized cupredoxin-like copper-binding protein